MGSDILPVAFALVGRCVYSQNSPNGHLSTVATFFGRGAVRSIIDSWSWLDIYQTVVPTDFAELFALKFFF